MSQLQGSSSPNVALDSPAPSTVGSVWPLDTTIDKSEQEVGDAVVSQPIRSAQDEARLEEAVGYMLDDCFFSIGQAVGDRKAIDQSAVVWWRDRYHEKFMRTLRRFGNTWLKDRRRVMATVRILANRAVHYAGENSSIDLQAAMRASKDMERYCALHATRRSRYSGASDAGISRWAGYYCTL